MEKPQLTMRKRIKKIKHSIDQEVQFYSSVTKKTNIVNTETVQEKKCPLGRRITRNMVNSSLSGCGSHKQIMGEPVVIQIQDSDSSCLCLSPDLLKIISFVGRTPLPKGRLSHCCMNFLWIYVGCNSFALIRVPEKKDITHTSRLPPDRTKIRLNLCYIFRVMGPNKLLL